MDSPGYGEQGRPCPCDARKAKTVAYQNIGGAKAGSIRARETGLITQMAAADLFGGRCTD